MSYKSVHVDYTVKGARYLINLKITVSLLKAIRIDDLFSWDVQQNGNTKFNDLGILLAFFRCNLNLRNAGALIGYNNGSDMSMSERIMRHNSRNVFELYTMFVRAGKLKKGSAKHILSGPLNRKSGRIGRASVYVAKAFCENALEKYGNNKTRTAKKLGVSLEVLNFWLNY
jgi:hypothetical protein